MAPDRLDWFCVELSASYLPPRGLVLSARMLAGVGPVLAIRVYMCWPEKAHAGVKAMVTDQPVRSLAAFAIVHLAVPGDWRRGLLWVRLPSCGRCPGGPSVVSASVALAFLWELRPPG